MDPVLEYIIVGMYGAVIVWLAFRSIGQGESIVGLKAQMTELSNKQTSIIQNQKQMNDKLDLFLKTEIDTLKSLIGTVQRKTR